SRRRSPWRRGPPAAPRPSCASFRRPRARAPAAVPGRGAWRGSASGGAVYSRPDASRPEAGRLLRLVGRDRRARERRGRRLLEDHAQPLQRDLELAPKPAAGAEALPERVEAGRRLAPGGEGDPRELRTVAREVIDHPRTCTAEAADSAFEAEPPRPLV